MKKGITHIALLFLISLLLNGKMLARQSATAVMEVKVEILASAHVIAHSHDLSSQLQRPDENGECEISLAKLNLTVPDGSSYHMSSEKNVTMSGNEGEMVAELNVEESRQDDGSVFMLSGVVDMKGAVYGLYVGNQMTTIEYD